MKIIVVRIGHKAVLLEMIKVKEFADRLHNIADSKNSCSYARRIFSVVYPIVFTFPSELE
jgi:hypothetical protein